MYEVPVLGSARILKLVSKSSVSGQSDLQIEYH